MLRPATSLHSLLRDTQRLPKTAKFGKFAESSTLIVKALIARFRHVVASCLSSYICFCRQREKGYTDERLSAGHIVFGSRG